MKKIIALLMIAAMLFCICACEKEVQSDVPDVQVSSDDAAETEEIKDFIKTDVETNEVETPYGNLAYPTEWKDNVKAETSEDGENYRVAFNAVFGEISVPLYTIVFGSSETGFLIGDLPYESGTVQVYCEDHTDSNIDDLTPEQQEKYSIMCGDINTIISHLVYDHGLTVN